MLRTAAMAMAIAPLLLLLVPAAGTAATATTANVRGAELAHEASPANARRMVRVANLRQDIRELRRTTWKHQRTYGADPYRTERAEARAIGIPYLRYLKGLWSDRMIAARRKAADYKKYSYRGSNGNVHLGQRMAARYGWHVGVQWEALYTLWNKESGWDHTSHNRSGSGACGIPQSMTSCFGYDPRAQIAWGLRYISGRYGTPVAALSHFYSRNWY